MDLKLSVVDMLWIVAVYGKVATATVIAIFNVAEAYFLPSLNNDELVASVPENFSQIRTNASVLLSEKMFSENIGRPFNTIYLCPNVDMCQR